MIPSINPNFVPKHLDIKEIQYYINGLKTGDKFVLSECITLLENNIITKRNLAIEILSLVDVVDRNTIRIGITGAPGAGKSTFIETYGFFLINAGFKVAVLAIDPSSQINHGSILGDKTRMEKLSTSSMAYIRPTPSSNVLGGVGAYTKQAIALCEAAGFDYILIETVGVGQSETEVEHISDINVLILQPGAGDDLQGIKRGIVENADIFVVNKSDGDLMGQAKLTKVAYENAVNLSHHEIFEHGRPVLCVSSVENKGINEFHEIIKDYIIEANEKNIFLQKRMMQENHWFKQAVLSLIQNAALKNQIISGALSQLSNDMVSKKRNASSALIEMEAAINKVFE